MVFQRSFLVATLSILLSGCGGDSDRSPQLPSTPPTTSCPDGSCLEDDGFTNPSLPMIPVEPPTIPPTASCPDGSCLEDDGFTNPSIPTIPIITLEIINIAGYLGWDTLEVNTLCTAVGVQCVLDDENDVVIKVSDDSYHDSHISEYRPIRKEIIGQAQYRSPDTMIENVMLNIEKSSTPETCNKVGILGPGKFRVYYGPFYPDDSVLLEWSTSGKTTDYYPCYYTQETNLGPVGGPPGPNTVYYFSPSAKVSSNLNANIILGNILYEHR